MLVETTGSFIKTFAAKRATTSVRPNTAAWIVLSFAAAAILAAIVLAVRGAGERGTDDALLVTGRLSFMLFLPAYVGGALVAFFGPVFLPVRQRGREFGLAFASAHLVHVGLVVWLCIIGATPPLATFVFFGVALAFLYLLALCSFAQVREAIGRRGWQVLQIVGMNYIAYAFATDFLKFKGYPRAGFVLAYLPFAVMSVVAIALVLASLAVRAGRAWGPMLPALMIRSRRQS